MSKVLGSIAKESFNIDDKVIIESLLASAEAKATMYLSAAITSTTPELRSAYAASLTQAIEAHTALTELAINKGGRVDEFV